MKVTMRSLLAALGCIMICMSCSRNKHAVQNDVQADTIQSDSVSPLNAISFGMPDIVNEWLTLNVSDFVVTTKLDQPPSVEKMDPVQIWTYPKHGITLTMKEVEGGYLVRKIVVSHPSSMTEMAGVHIGMSEDSAGLIYKGTIDTIASIPGKVIHLGGPIKKTCFNIENGAVSQIVIGE